MVSVACCLRGSSDVQRVGLCVCVCVCVSVSVRRFYIDLWNSTVLWERLFRRPTIIYIYIKYIKVA